MDHVQPLSKIVRERLTALNGGTEPSLRTGATIIARHGGNTSHTTLGKIFNDERPSIEEPTVRSLEAIGIDRQTIYRSLGVTSPDDPTPFDLPVEAQKLSRRQRRAVLAVVDAMLEQRTELEAQLRRAELVRELEQSEASMAGFYGFTRDDYRPAAHERTDAELARLEAEERMQAEDDNQDIDDEN